MKIADFKRRTVVIAAAALTIGASISVSAVQASGITKPITITYASPNPAGDPTQQAITWFMEEVTKRSGGKITFQAHLGNSLVKDQDLLSAVGDGVVDMGKIYTVSYPGQMPLWNLANIPFTHPSPGVIQQTMHALDKKYPAFSAELAKLNVKALGLIATGGTQIVSRIPIKSYDDLKGLKIRARGVQAAAFVAAGAAPVSIPWNDVYEALSKGVVDATTNYILSMRAVRHNEVAGYFISVDMGQAVQMEIVNLEFWKKLPEDARKMLTEVMIEAEARYVEVGAKAAVAERELMSKKENGGIVFSRLSQAELDKWKAANPSFTDKWADENKGNADSKAVIADFVILQNQYGAEAEKNQLVGMW